MSYRHRTLNGQSQCMASLNELVPHWRNLDYDLIKFCMKNPSMMIKFYCPSLCVGTTSEDGCLIVGCTRKCRFNLKCIDG